MTSGGAERLVGEWIGVLEFSGEVLFVKVSWQDGERLAGTLDRPGALTFREPLTDVRLDADRLRFGVPVEGGALLFDACLTDGQIRGSVQRGPARGTIHLSPAASSDPSIVTGYVGTYRVDPAATILVTFQGDAPNRLMFYARGDCLVPLHPLSATTLLSELGETIDAVRDEAGTVVGLRWRRGDGGETFTPRTRIYGEAEVRFENGDVTLAGTLLVPPEKGPRPGVVIMHGSGPSERDFYRVYADRFARRGIAALIYDKRGSGASTETARSTIVDRAEDGLSGVRFLQTRPEIDPHQVGLWGFSNSTWSLPVAAARSTDVAFLIATGATGVSMARAEVHRKVFELREWGVSEDTLAGIARAWSIWYEYAATGHWDDAWDAEWSALVERFEADELLRQIPLQDYARANPWLSPIPPLIAVGDLKGRYGGAAPDMNYDPVIDYERVRCPVLFIVGELDENLPARESAERVGAALERAGHPDYTVRVIPRAGHMLNMAYAKLRGASTEEATGRLHSFRFVPGYLDPMSDWILTHTSAGA